MFSWFRNRRRRGLLQRSDLSLNHWNPVWQDVPTLQGLTPEQGTRLRELATLFIAEKAIEPVRGLVVNDAMGQYIALHACLPLVGLDIDWYRTWHAVVLYPDTFVSTFHEQDAAGVVHRVREPRMGESWDRGPLVLSWADALATGEYLDGYNVIVHECAHKLDALDGVANGKPPLHRGMSVQQWADVFGTAYEEMLGELDRGIEPVIDPYGSEAPEEFFAVVSEAFFEVPQILIDTYPAVYEQMRLFYKQDPLQRMFSPT